MAKLVSIDQKAATAPKGSARGILDWLNSHPLPEQARRSTAAMEKAIKEERDAWD
jgi:hypothetical protein